MNTPQQPHNQQHWRIRVVVACVIALSSIATVINLVRFTQSSTSSIAYTDADWDASPRGTSTTISTALVSEASSPLPSSSHHKRALLHQLWNQLTEPEDPRAQASHMKLTHYLPARQTHWNPEINVGMVTHGSADKIATNLDIQLRWWNGTSSVALYLQSPNDIDAFMEYYQAHQHETFLQHVSFHILLEKSNMGYPHNILRNMALEHLYDADFFVALDGDFITNPNAYASMAWQLQNDKELVGRLRYRELFLLPAFELLPLEGRGGTTYPSEINLPRTKQQVKDKCMNLEMIRFHRFSAPKAHMPTKYKVWLFQQNLTKAYYPADPHILTFEPYILGYRKGIPRYTESFRGFGMNKASWFQELDHAGYKYNVLCGSGSVLSGNDTWRSCRATIGVQKCVVVCPQLQKYQRGRQVCAFPSRFAIVDLVLELVSDAASQQYTGITPAQKGSEP